MSDERQRERVLLYLYDELSPRERTAFESELERDPELRAILAEEAGFERLVPIGSGQPLSDELLAESRQSLRAALERQATAVDRASAGITSGTAADERDSLLARLGRRLMPILSRPLPATCAIAAAAVVLLLAGILLGRTALQPAPAASPPVAALSPADLIGADDLDIVDLRVASFDRASGQISLAFEAVSSVAITGNVEQPEVQNLLVTAMRAELRPGTRLETMEILAAQDASEEIRAALIDALLNDSNPAVRLGAIEALKDLATNDQVRGALRQALLHDGNPGVRVEAIEVLRDFQEPATLEVLQEKMETDGNVYIRAEAERAFKQWSGETTDQL